MEVQSSVAPTEIEKTLHFDEIGLKPPLPPTTLLSPVPIALEASTSDDPVVVCIKVRDAAILLKPRLIVEALTETNSQDF